MTLLATATSRAHPPVREADIPPDPDWESECGFRWADLVAVRVDEHDPDDRAFTTDTDGA